MNDLKAGSNLEKILKSGQFAFTGELGPPRRKDSSPISRWSAGTETGLPCSPTFYLDGVWVSACHPGDCHYIEGNYYARRKFALFKNLLEYSGLEPGRLHFSWISSAESTSFVKVVNQVVESVNNLGPAKVWIKKAPAETAIS